jgi:hypothetical protein
MSTGSIDPHALLKVLYTSLAAGVGVTIVFSLVVLGVIRSGELRRSSRTAAAAGYAVLASTGLIVVAATIVYGLILLGHKS